MTNLKCNGWCPKENPKPVTHIDSKGFIYCEGCGFRRKQSQRCRKLKPAELKLLQSGQPIARY